MDERTPEGSPPPDDLACPYCGAPGVETGRLCPVCGASLHVAKVRGEVGRLERRRARHLALMLAFGLPGLGSIIAGCALLEPQTTREWGVGLWFVGLVLFLLGLGYGVLYKRDNPAWLFLATLGLIGVVLLALLPDRNKRRLARLRSFLAAQGDDPPPDPGST